MAGETQVVRDFLAAMEPVKEALGDFVCALHRRPEVKLAQVYHPSAYLCSDFGISAELRNGAVVDFWIELAGKGSTWELTYSIQRHEPDEDGSHAVTDFPAQRIEASLKLPSAILGAVKELRERSADDALFTSP